MVLFTDVEPDVPHGARRSTWVGWLLVIVGLVAALVIAVTPAPYVIERPGPVFNTLGDTRVGGEERPLIQIPDQETFETDGALSLLTVTVSGNPQQLPTWIDIALAWFDPSKKVVPVAEVFPPGTTLEQSNEQSRVDMENSKQEAIAAAMTELDYEYTSTLTIVATTDGLPADGVLREGDRIVSLNGEAFTDVTSLREAIAENGTDAAAEVVVDRDGEQVTEELTPVPGPDGKPVLGITVGSEYDFPFAVDIELDDVGGPSAGMMFALGIIDKLTPGELNGGENVAGTGTITAAGEVGPIGGIRQKMYGALGSGADWFLAPAGNCEEVVGNVPEGLEVFAVQTLDDAEAAVEGIAAGDTADLPGCEAFAG
ncbi:PDZ domain-containing protein [Diaminobutyricimonas aerilata]|uniref:endopeptidase La n=1 Tax=Diaminobutyricimonas aerilata TaxID=1162967 RepID=A0A2M9CI84_9MICO|nr:S16 family serine protease [Diaminobutyricimonas aerilata]PJJ71624.1 PDZ domain-containing protein [Diaminobutyricimonas aerilata]